MKKLLACSIILVATVSSLAAITNSIAPGQTVGDTTGELDFDVYEYPSAGNERVTIALAAISGGGQFGPVFDIISPAGAALLSNQTFVSAFFLSNAGTYQIICRDADAFDGGSYNLTLIRHPGPNEPDAGETNAIIAGVTVGGRTGWSDMDVYEYASAGNERVTIALSRITDAAFFGPVFDVVSPGGVLLLSNQTLLHAYSLTDPGTYQILCRDADAVDAGSYDLTLIRHPGPNEPDSGEANTIVAGITVGGSTGWSDLDVYEYASPGNERLTIALARISDAAFFGPVFDVVSPGGALLLSNQTLLQAYLLTDPGTYQIICRDADAVDAGEYDITLIRHPGPNQPDAGETNGFGPGMTIINGHLGWSDMDCYEFDAIAGDSLVVMLRSHGGGGFGASVVLYDSDGAVTASGSGVNQCLDRTGRFQLVFRDADLHDAGSYSATISHTPGPPPSYDPVNPYLAIFRCATNTVLRWPTNAERFQLEYQTDAASGAWSNVSPPYAVIANHYYVTNRSTDPARFYRLRYQ